MTYPQQHQCSDGTLYKWEARKPQPKSCPRCKQRLDVPKKEEKNA